MSGAVGPRDPGLRGLWRRERRALIKTHHPDRGGSAEELTMRLARLDQAFQHYEPRITNSALVVRSGPSRWQPVRRLTTRASRRARQKLRKVRSVIPSEWPGSRRYFDL